MTSENAERDKDGGEGGGLTDGERRTVRGFIASGMEMASASDRAIASQINEKHVTDIVGLMGKELEYRYIDRQRARVFWSIMAAFAIIMAVAFSVFLSLLSLELLLFDLAKGAAVFLGGMVGGLGAGYGLARRRDDG